MGDSSFTHLHVHTEFSMLDGAARLDELVAKAVADGQPAIGITDHGNMYGVLDFYKECQKHGVKPVIGTEAYMAHDHRSERPTRRGRSDDSGGNTDGGNKLYYHLTLLAENDTGYQNLIQLSSRAFLEGYYYKPRLDWELLSTYAEGVIATTGCLGGHVLQSLLRGDVDGATQKAGRLQDIFGKDNLFVELQDHGLAEQRTTNPQLIDIATRIGAPLLATNDSHYTHREDHESHDALLCVQTASVISDPNRFKFEGHEHYLKTADEMRYLFRDYPEACDNTLWVAERADVTIEFGKVELPDFPLPEGFTDADAYLAHLTWEGARKRWGAELDGAARQGVVERIQFELDTISSMGFSAYFLIVWDLIAYARGRDIRVGPGRGCLHGDSQIWTADGYKPIRDVRTGDLVRSHTGAVRTVSNTFRYEADEQLVTVRGFLDGLGVTMTSDHKVLIRREERETDTGRRSHGGVLSRQVSSPMEWVKAGRIRVGDLLCIPRPPSPGTAPRSIDVALLLPPVPEGCEFEVTRNEIVERIPISAAFPHSIREVSRTSGVSRNSIRHIVCRGVPFSGTVPASMRRGVASERMRDRVLAELRRRGFETLAAYHEHLTQNTGLRRYSHSIDAVARAARVNPPTLRSVVSRYPESGPIEHATSASSAATAARDALAEELRFRGFQSFASWESWVRAHATVEVRTPRHIAVDDDLLFILGAYVSDGWIRRDSSRVVGFAERRSEIDDTIPLRVKRIWGLDVTRDDHTSTDLTQTFVRSAAVRALFHHLVPGYDFTAQTKRLPEWFGDLDVDQKRVLLSGLWWGDGSSSPERSQFATSSARLMQQVRDLLWAVGAPAGVRVDDRTDDRPAYANRSAAWTIRTTPKLTAPKAQFGWADDNFVYSRVRSAEVCERVSEVFDLEVPVDHSFMTDSYVVHNSAAGCAVAYCLWITDLDPIRYDLLFERFLNPSRISMPDIDMDFDSRYRDEMIRYASSKYGRDHVAQIITFGTIKARNGVRDAARVLGMPYAVGDKIAKAVPPLVMGRDTPLKYCFERSDKFADGYKAAADLRAMYDADPDVKKVVDVAKGLEGLKRSDGIHAAAVVITKEPLTTYLPVQRKPESGQRPEEAPVITQYEMHGVDDLGLLKMDFLGLRNLDVITDTVEMVRAQRDVTFDVDTIPLDDAKTLELLQRGSGIGVFQLEGGPMRALMRTLRPTSFEDVAALLALYRPGPMAANMHTDYADRKNGRKPIEYDHDDLQEVLGDTYGLMVYQESMMRVAQKVAGYTLADADNLRRACLPAGSRVLTRARGYLPIERVMSLTDRRVQTIDTTSCTTRFDEVADVWPVGVKPVLRLTTSSGYTIEATAEHPLLVGSFWCSLGSIVPGDRVGVAARADVRVGTGVGELSRQESASSAHQWSEPRPESTSGTGALLWDKVVSVEYVRDAECFDFRMANPDRPYAVVEDFLVHNCGKKSRELIVVERAKFVEGCERTGYTKALGTKLFDIIEPFADYAFGRSHAFGYALVAFQTAYLKAHYPVEYLACLLSSVRASLERAAVYIAECRSMGIRVLPPDINRSVTNFASLAPGDVPDGVKLPVGSPGAITFGLSAVRNVGEGLVAQLLTERDANGPYASFHEFADRVPEPVLNKRAVESLIKGGAFDSLGHPRRGLLGVFEQITNTTLGRRREREMGVMSLFGDEMSSTDPESGGARFDERLAVPAVEFDKSDLLRAEKEMLGLYVSDHPLFGKEAALRRKVDHSIADLEDMADGALVHIGGVITALSRRFTKRGDQMATFTLEDLAASIEVTLFPRSLVEHGHKLTEDLIVAVRGRLDKRDESRVGVILQGLEVLAGLDDGSAPTLTVRIPAVRLGPLEIDTLKRILSNQPGASPVVLDLGTERIRLTDEFRVDLDRVVPEIRMAFGHGAIDL